MDYISKQKTELLLTQSGIYENFHYADESEAYDFGQYNTYNEAMTADFYPDKLLEVL